MPGLLFTSKTYGGLFSGSLDGIKSTAVKIPPTAFAARILCSSSKVVKLYLIAIMLNNAIY